MHLGEKSSMALLLESKVKMSAGGKADALTFQEITFICCRSKQHVSFSV